MSLIIATQLLTWAKRKVDRSLRRAMLILQPRNLFGAHYEQLRCFGFNIARGAADPPQILPWCESQPFELSITPH